MSHPRADYTSEIVIGVPCERAFDAIATVEGIRGWWTPLVRGSDEVGGTLQLGFEGMDEHIDLRVNASRRPRHVEWSVIEHSSLDEWAGTTIHFHLSPHGPNACRLAFQHRGLSPRLDCYDECQAGWNHFLQSLVAFATHGQGQPFRADSTG